MSNERAINYDQRHESVAELLKTYRFSKDPKVIIQFLAKQKLAYARDLGWEGPPFCPKTLCSIFGIRCVTVQHDIACDGRLVLLPTGKPLIEYRENRPVERIRFTLFHELAHTLFPDYCDFVPHHHNSEVNISKADREFENLCDSAAAEMLFPYEEFYTDLCSIDSYSFNNISQLAQLYKASLEATSIRISEVDREVPIAFGFLSTDRKPSYKGGGPLWVNYVWQTKAFPMYIPTGTAVPNSSVANTCLTSGNYKTIIGPQKETWWLNGKPRTLWVEAIRLLDVAGRSYPKVLVLITPRKLLINSDYRESMLFV